MLIVTPKGGHLGWVAGPEAPRGCPWTDPHVMDFLEYIEHGKSASAACASNQETMNNGVTERFQHLEVQQQGVEFKYSIMLIETVIYAH